MLKFNKDTVKPLAWRRNESGEEFYVAEVPFITFNIYKTETPNSDEGECWHIICISENIYVKVDNKIDLSTADMGKAKSLEEAKEKCWMFWLTFVKELYKDIMV